MGVPPNTHPLARDGQPLFLCDCTTHLNSFFCSRVRSFPGARRYSLSRKQPQGSCRLIGRGTFSPPYLVAQSVGKTRTLSEGEQWPNLARDGFTNPGSDDDTNFSSTLSCGQRRIGLRRCQDPRNG